MRKIWVIIILLTFGFTSKNTNNINYNLQIDDYYQEKIEFILSHDAYQKAEKNKDESYTSMEYALLYNKQEPIHSIHDKFYLKDIKKSNENIIVSLKYNYNEQDFMYSNYIMNCFEEYKIDSKDDYFDIKLSGEFYCLQDKTLNINIFTKNQVLETNGIKDNDGYSWTINQNNYKNTNIRYKIKRNFENMEQIVFNDEDDNNNVWELIRGVLIMGVVFGLLILGYNYLKKRNYIY